ncbi:MAG: YncE family protein, partial [Rikenellaceae bacterium]|nr:YncE family protein [Rikenellaceae bacterium]
ANMGSNKVTLDYFDYQTGYYITNIYPAINPDVVNEMGDVGNDLKIYGGKMYAVINCSHLVDIMDAATASHLGSVSILNCRYITFDGAYAYISSYNTPVDKENPDTPLGSVIKMDTTDYSIVATCTVGYQPEEMVVRDGKLYVANSGGYRPPDYDNTVSVIDLETFTEIKKITVGINLHRMVIDNYDNIYVSSRGDFYNVWSNLYIIGKNDLVTKSFNLSVSGMALMGDSLYYFACERNKITQTNSISYGIIDTSTMTQISSNFIKDGTESTIEVPYGIAANSETGEIFLTDAKDYVTPGTIFCFDKEGHLQWKTLTGDIPAHIAFTSRRLESADELIEQKQ